MNSINCLLEGMVNSSFLLAKGSEKKQSIILSHMVNNFLECSNGRAMFSHVHVDTLETIEKAIRSSDELEGKYHVIFCRNIGMSGGISGPSDFAMGYIEPIEVNG